MKVTPIDIRHKEFRRAMRGYSEEEVDLFLDEVADDFEVLFKENIELQDEIHRLKEQVAQYDNLKETLQKTLISAQQQADETRANARKESELILRDAELQSRNIIADSYTEKQKVQQSVVQLRQAEDDFRFKFRSLLEAHLNLLMEDEASEDRRRFRDAANGTAEQPAVDETLAPEATVLISPQAQAARDDATPEAFPTETAAESGPPTAPPDRRPTVEAEHERAEVVSAAAMPSFAPTVSSAEGTVKSSVAFSPAAVAMKPEAPVADRPAAQEVAASSSREAAEGPPSWLGPVSASSMSSAAEPLDPVPASPVHPGVADTSRASSGAGATAVRAAASADRIARAPMAPRGGAEQDVSAFDDFDDLDFGLPEDPDSGLEGLAGEKKSGKKQSPVRRFLFGSKNASRPGRDPEEKDDRDFDW